MTIATVLLSGATSRCQLRVLLMMQAIAKTSEASNPCLTTGTI
ncbi:MAG: hypothetical protein RMZ69_23630 [Nostoc sp. ChiQUE01a]|nr:hypothetical protein [Nostoc sp. ChiQUE01a]